MFNRRHSTVWLASALMLAGCVSTLPPAPPPADVAKAPILSAATDERLGAIGANAEAALFAADHIADPTVKAATVGPLRVILSLAPGPYPAEANAGWTSARVAGEAQAQRIKQLEAEVAAQRIEAANELTRQLQAARDEERAKAEARERQFQQWLFFGLGTLLMLGAVATIALRAYFPLFGPQVTIWLGAAGGMLILLGIVVRAVSRLIDDHPYIFWGGIVAVIVSITLAVGLIISNHFHLKEENK